MPREKDLKRLVRNRMKKTGESYTAARAQLVAKKIPTAAECTAITGMKNETVIAKTGQGWPEWVETLDAVQATSLSHKEIARHLFDTYELVSGWWAQSITVGYERIRGLRDVGQRRGGAYDANKSRTFAVPVATLYRAWGESRRRAKWLPGVDLAIRTSTREKSMRISWPDGTNVDAHFTDKGAKSSVAIQHRGLPSRAAAEKAKADWAARLDSLRDYLRA